MEIKGIKAKLVDVFAEGKLTGNGLTIFWECPPPFLPGDAGVNPGNASIRGHI